MLLAGPKRTNAAIFHNTNKPPIAVAVIEKNHGVSFGCIGLSIDRRDEIVEGVNEFKVDIL